MFYLIGDLYFGPYHSIYERNKFVYQLQTILWFVFHSTVQNWWLFSFVTFVFNFLCLTIDVHRLKIQGGGYGMFFPKFWVEGSRCWKKIMGVVILFAFYCILIKKFYKKNPGGLSLYPIWTPPSPLCAFMRPNEGWV